MLVAMALTEEELCLSIVRVWALVKDDDTCRYVCWLDHLLDACSSSDKQVADD